MILTLFAGLLASSVLTTSLPATPNIVPDYSFSQIITQDSYSSYIVQNGDYLSKIANAYYGSEDYWTNIWNDNPEVDNAAQLEPGIVLKIRKVKTIMPEVLKEELENRVSIDGPVYSYTAKIETIPDNTNTVVQEPVAPTVNIVQTAEAPKILSDEQITHLGNCEAGMNPARNSGNGYYGAFQFSEATWRSMNTGYDRADLAPIEVQKEAVQRLVARSSIYTQFPACSRKMQSAGII